MIKTPFYIPDVIFIAQLRENIIIDKIPMCEVEHVGEMSAIMQTSSEAAELMIETHPEGYNSGRIYYLQAESRAMCQNLISKLKQYCAAARERANAKTALAQARQHARKLYRSKNFQNVVAILIIAVCQFKTFQGIYFDLFLDTCRISSFACSTHNTLLLKTEESTSHV